MVIHNHYIGPGTASAAWAITAITALMGLSTAIFDRPIFGILLVGIPGLYLTFLQLRRGLRADKLTAAAGSDNVALRVQLATCAAERTALQERVDDLEHRYLT